MPIPTQAKQTSLLRPLNRLRLLLQPLARVLRQQRADLVQALVIVCVHPLDLLVRSDTEIEHLRLDRREGDVLKAVIGTPELVRRVCVPYHHHVLDPNAKVPVLVVARLYPIW